MSKVARLIARLMAAIETPDDLNQEDVNCLLEDAHIVLQEIEMNKTYVMAVDSMLAITANSEEEAREEAKQQFVEMLQKREVEFVCVDGWED